MPPVKAGTWQTHGIPTIVVIVVSATSLSNSNSVAKSISDYRKHSVSLILSQYLVNTGTFMPLMEVDIWYIIEYAVSP